jgi:hypothetical protein
VVIEISLGPYELRYLWSPAPKIIEVVEVTKDKVVTTRNVWPRSQFEMFIRWGVLKWRGGWEVKA